MGSGRMAPREIIVNGRLGLHLSRFRLRLLGGNHKQIVEVQIAKTDHGKSVKNLEPHVFDAPQETALVARDTLNGMRVYAVNRRKATTLQEPAHTVEIYRPGLLSPTRLRAAP